jgi:hypothetical protein
MPDSYVDVQLVATIIIGIGFEILKEAKGLSWAIGAHAINNLSAVLPRACRQLLIASIQGYFSSRWQHCFIGHIFEYCL